MGPTSPEQGKALASIETSGRYLLTLINDVLDLAKIEADKMTVQYETVNLFDLCNSSLLSIKEEAQLKRLRTNFTTSSAPQLIHTDPLRFKQILINLLSNAVKFTPVGGEIELSVVGVSQERKHRITVSDTGIGISAEDQERLFQPFSQVDSSHTRNYGGSGLGLALVMRLTTLLGGEVTLESEPGKGSRFTVTLPHYTCAGDLDPSGWDRPASDIPDVPAQTARQSLVLVAEDNRNTADMVTEYLSLNGYRTVVATSGHEAVTLARTERPDVILMDIQMPEMSGLDAIRAIRNFPPPDNGIPIIALTALVMPGDRERCLEVGADVYLSKPFRLSTLKSSMSELLDKTDLQRRPPSPGTSL